MFIVKYKTYKVLIERKGLDDKSSTHDILLLPRHDSNKFLLQEVCVCVREGGGGGG